MLRFLKTKHITGGENAGHYVGTVRLRNNKIVTVRFTEKQVEAAQKLAAKNSEDFVTEQQYNRAAQQLSKKILIVQTLLSEIDDLEDKILDRLAFLDGDKYISADLKKKYSDGTE